MKEAIVVHSHIVGLGVIRALGRMGVPMIALYYDGSTEMARFSKYVKKSIRVPHPCRSEQQLIAFLLDAKSNLHGKVLIPCDDYSVVCLSRYKKELQSKYIVAVPEWESVEKIIEKHHTYTLAERLNIPGPRIIAPRTIADVENHMAEFEFPCIIKPIESHKFYDHFKTKMFLVNDRNDLIQKYQLATWNGFKVMVSEYIPGDDTQGVNYNSYFIDGKPVAEFTARKVRLDPPQFGRPRVVVSAAVPEVMSWGRLILKELNFYGFSCIEFKRDVRDGIYKLMEINGRHNLSASLAVKCGINFPWIEYNYLVNGRIINVDPQKQDGYWIELLKDSMHFFVSRKQEQLSLWAYIRPYLKPKVFGILSLSDPLPFMGRILFVQLHFILAIYNGLKGVLKRFGVRFKVSTTRLE